MSTAISLDYIESRAERTMAVVTYARTFRDGVFACVICVPLLFVLDRKLTEIRGLLGTDFLEGIEDEQARELAELLRQLSYRLGRFIDSMKSSGYCRFKPMSRALVRIENRQDDIDSVTENIYISRNLELHRAISSAIDSLNFHVEKRPAMPNRHLA